MFSSKQSDLETEIKKLNVKASTWWNIYSIIGILEHLEESEGVN